jgi:hypothetical protein
MTSSSTQLPTTPEGPRRRDQPRINAAWNAVLWLAVIAFAVAPFLWW